ncbi:MAG: helicase-related protein [Nanoarchaeota archaeon]|nr:helicase-related protein [Nanoarchaeota archaeon]
MNALKEFTPRLYQETILNTCVRNNTLVVLPTGMGKTAIALMLASHRLGSYPNSKILFLAPTKPLVSQHLASFKKYLEDIPMSVMTGEISPEKREKLWQESTIIFSTPQGLSNDIVNSRIKLEEVSCLILDEIHRCTGDYDYVWICEQYSGKASYPRILGLTASPGSTLEQIKEICRNAYIDEIEVRTHEDPDVKPYVQETDVDYVNVELSEEFKTIQKFISECLKERIKELKQYGYFNYSGKPSRKDLLDIQGSLHKRIAEGEKSIELWRAVSLGAEAIKVQHALDLLETQGISALKQYFEKLFEEAVKTKTKATKRIVADVNFKSAFAISSRLFEEGIEHPKIAVLKEMVKNAVDKKKDAKIIVFNNYRDSALKLTNELNMLQGVSAKLFVGQMKKKETGLKQKEQLKMLDEFRNAEFNCLVSSSVGEEGLDIPAVDMVIFYEPVASAIRQIQRRGRTGRLEKGAVKILVTKGTIDEAYRWSSFHREKKMYSVLYELKKKMKIDVEKKEQPTLSDYDDSLKIFADTREQHSGVAKELVSKGVSVKMQKLMVGDFILSERVGVERKSILGDTPIIIKKDNEILVLPIQEAYKLYHKNKGNFKAMGIDLNKKQIGWFDIYNATEHYSNELYYLSFNPDVKLKGKEEIFNIGLTGGHNIFVFRKQKICCIPTSELKKGDYLLIVPPKLDQKERVAGFSFCDFLKYVQSDSIKSFRIRGNKFRLNSTRTWYKIPKFSSNFFFIVGLWVADGFYKQGYGIGITQKSKERNEIIESILRKEIGSFSVNSNSYDFGGKSYFKLFKDFLKLKPGAENKNVPPILFSMNGQAKAAFLRGYFFGDGWVNNSTNRNNPQIKAVSKSKLLIAGLSYLLYSLGIQNKVKSIFKSYKNKRMKYYSLNIKTISLKQFLDKVGQIPTKEIKLNKSISTPLPYYASLHTKKRILKLSGGEVIKLYNEISKLRVIYASLDNYLLQFKAKIRVSANKKALSKQYKINYSTLRNITNSNLKVTLYPIKLINILRADCGLPPISINFELIKKYLRKLKIRTYLNIYPKPLYSEKVIRNVYEKIEKVIGFDSLFVASKIYAKDLFLEKVYNIKKAKRKVLVYDLSVKDAENFVGGDIPVLLHNTIEDFVGSIIDQRILQQAKELKQNFEKPLMIIEGTDDLYSVRRVHPNAIRGMIAAIAVSFGIPIVHTKSPSDTAELLIAIAKREQTKEDSDFTLRTEKKPLTLKEQQEYIVQSFPNVGSQLSRDLLLKFGSVKNIVNADTDKLREVEKIGEKKAAEIKRVVEEDYLG